MLTHLGCWCLLLLAGSPKPSVVLPKSAVLAACKPPSTCYGACKAHADAMTFGMKGEGMAACSFESCKAIQHRQACLEPGTIGSTHCWKGRNSIMQTRNKPLACWTSFYAYGYRYSCMLAGCSMLLQGMMACPSGYSPPMLIHEESPLEQAGLCSSLTFHPLLAA